MWTQRGGQKTKRIGVREVLEVRRSLKRLVVVELDKNKNRLWCECPRLHEERFTKMVVNDPGFKLKCSGEKQIGELVTEMKRDYEESGFGEVVKWGRGAIPTTIVLPKDKAPENKTRLVNSYRVYPARKFLRLVSKAIH